ncbi:MAG: RagB/SusD family nutrient uptake outer membrane protein [Candidatus Cryptobacteroides sp.]
MKIIFRHLIFVTVLIAAASCTLSRENYTEITPDNFYKTETDLELAVNALYYDFNTGDWNGVYDPGYHGYMTLSDMVTDVMWCNWGWEADSYHFMQIGKTDSAISDDMWTDFSRYNFLSKARNVIRKIEDSEVPDETKKPYIGEAKALRGWMALFLYDLFGPVPVAPDEVLDDPQTFVYLPRLSEDEYMDMMESDLLDAIEYLPAKASERGRMDKGAARMILLKYYMIKGDFEKAEPVARALYEMGQSGLYSLQSDYSYVFSKEGNGNNEVILCIPSSSSATSTSNYIVAECLPTDMPWTDKATGWGGYVMPWAFYDTFEAGDARLKCLCDHYTNTKGVEVSRDAMYYGAVICKYGKDPEMMDARCFIDVVIYRYADVLLSYAECMVRNSGGPTPLAIELVNQVRGRAGLDELDASATGSLDAFMDALLLERGHEFFLEGLRRQDLIRFGKFVENANARIDAVNEKESRGYIHIDETRERFFIPEYFIKESKDKITQNPGY